jgi:hypothetical protein
MTLTLNKPLAAILLALASSTCAWAQVAEGEPAVASVAATGELAPAYASDLREIMEATLAYRYLSGTRNLDLNKLPAADREFELVFRRQIKPEDLLRQLQPAYARVFTAAQAHQLAQLMRAPAFRKREQLSYDMPGVSGIAFAAYFTAAEKAEISRIVAMPIMATYTAQQSKLGAEVREVLRAMAKQYGRQVAARAMVALRKVDADLKAAHAAGNGVTIKIDQVGLAYMDKMVWVIGSSMIKVDNAHRRFENGLKRLAFDDVLKPSVLVSQTGRAHSREVVESAETLLDALLVDADAAFKEREEGLRAIDFIHKEEYVKQINQALGNAYGFMIDYGEATRHVLDEYRHVLAFCDERNGKLHVENERLLFEGDADLQAARQVFRQVDAARDALNRLIDEQNRSDDATLRGKQAPKSS